MKRIACALMAAALMAALCGSALADQKVRLPESSYRLTLPDGMQYDGPGGSGESFAYVDESIGLDISFFCYDGRGKTLEAIAPEIQGQCDSASIRQIQNGIKVLVYEVRDPADPPQKGMKCIGYVMEDGSRIQEICFWYATQKAADLTGTIIESLHKE